MVYALCTSKKAHNVNKTSVDLSRQDEGEESFGSTPIARTLVRFSMTIANGLSKVMPESGKRWIETRFQKDEAIIADGAAFDLVRASINLVLAGLLIALGTSLKLPLSTFVLAGEVDGSLDYIVCFLGCAQRIYHDGARTDKEVPRCFGRAEQ